MLKSVKDIVFGTWGISGAFNDYSLKEIENVIKVALDFGVDTFDSAVVYRHGEMDGLLNKLLPKDCIISTKIPAIVKPNTQDPRVDIDSCYPVEYLKESMDRINQEFAGRRFIVQLHNWHHSWDSEKVLQILLPYEDDNLLKIGVSVSDDYNSKYPEGFDMVQSAYNLLNRKHEAYFVKFSGEKWVREVFNHGILSSLVVPNYSNFDARSKKITPEIVQRFNQLKTDLDVKTNEDLKKAAVEFCAKCEWIDKIVVGFTKSEHVYNFMQLFSDLVS